MTPSSVQDDLAFMKSLTDGAVARRHQAQFGKIYFAAGVIYGFQVVVQWAAYAKLIVMPIDDGLFILAINFIFLSYLGWEMWNNRGLGQGTMTNRAINAAFAAIGAANLAVTLILFIGAWRLDNQMIGVLIPCVIFALQGAAWFVAYTLRRRAWLGVVAAGWMVTSIAMAFYVGSITFMLLIGLGILLWMAVPGFVMMRLASKAA